MYIPNSVSGEKAFFEKIEGAHFELQIYWQLCVYGCEAIRNLPDIFRRKF
jgi:hypothetical protein